MNNTASKPVLLLVLLTIFLPIQGIVSGDIEDIPNFDQPEMINEGIHRGTISEDEVGYFVFNTPPFTSVLIQLDSPHNDTTMIASIPQTADATAAAMTARGHLLNFGSCGPSMVPVIL